MVSLLFLPSCNTPPLKKKTTIPVGGGTLQIFMQGDCARGSTDLTRSYTIFGTTTTNSACDIRGLFRHFRVS